MDKFFKRKTDTVPKEPTLEDIYRLAVLVSTHITAEKLIEAIGTAEEEIGLTFAKEQNEK